MKKIILLCLTAISLCQAADATLGRPDKLQMVKLTLDEVIGENDTLKEKDWEQAQDFYLELFPTGRLLIKLDGTEAMLNDTSSKLIRDIFSNLFLFMENLFPNLQSLVIKGMNISELPANFNPPRLEWLNLADNEIHDDVINQMIDRFTDRNYLPNLSHLDLSNNPITQNAVERLRGVLREQGRDINVKADNLTGDFLWHQRGL